MRWRFWVVGILALDLDLREVLRFCLEFVWELEDVLTAWVTATCADVKAESSLEAMEPWNRI